MSNDNKPEITFRDGAMKASIWRNETHDGGAYYTTRIVNAYKDDAGKWRDSDRFTSVELLKIAELARSAYSHIGYLRDKDQRLRA